MERLGKWFSLTALLAALVLAPPASALAQGWRGAPAGGGAHPAAPAGHMGGAYGGHPAGGWYGGVPRGAPAYGGGWRYHGGPAYHYGYGYRGPYVAGYVGYPGFYWGWPGYWGWNSGVRVWSSSSAAPYPIAQYPGWNWIEGRWTWNGASWVWVPGRWAPARY